MNTLSSSSPSHSRNVWGLAVAIGLLIAPGAYAQKGHVGGGGHMGGAAHTGGGNMGGGHMNGNMGGGHMNGNMGGGNMGGMMGGGNMNGGRNSGGMPRTPKSNAPHQSNNMPRTPRAGNNSLGRAGGAMTKSKSAMSSTTRNGGRLAGATKGGHVTGSSTTGSAKKSVAVTAGATKGAKVVGGTTGGTHAGTKGQAATSLTHTTGTGTTVAHHRPVYTYGSGTHARALRVRGFGRGYRHYAYGRRYRYGRSQTSNRVLVARLRSAHATLARLDTNYQGHRVRAMHSVAMAIRQLSNRSTGYRSTGSFASRSMGSSYGSSGRRTSLPQQVSDARMAQAMRTLQGVDVQLANLRSFNHGHYNARSHVENGIHELSNALAIR